MRVEHGHQSAVRDGWTAAKQVRVVLEVRVKDGKTLGDGLLDRGDALRRDTELDRVVARLVEELGAKLEALLQAEVLRRVLDKP
jgi:hypothetical protein